ncbi:ATP-binding protein [Allochromatium tepidum]|uniref:ATP-binding protein n=1 Tax=Allochromatium tepidum TaxID=553982 RepID=UPI001BCF9665|nr:ATP-binding protein [Allochromatium tepidum]
MRLSIHSKVFLTLLLACVVVLAGSHAFVQWSFQRGLVEFADAREQERIARVIERLVDIHQREGSWRALIEDRRLWFYALHGRHDPWSEPRPERPERGPSWMPALSSHPGRPALDHRPGHALEFEDALREPILIQADAQRLSQLFRNLLGNSRKYTDPGGGLSIRLWRDTGRVVIDFQDSAPGVPVEDLPRLFERLYRVEGSRSRQTGGAGLGPAIARNVVEAHGGTITTQAAPQGGLWGRTARARGRRRDRTDRRRVRPARNPAWRAGAHLLA